MVTRTRILIAALILAMWFGPATAADLRITTSDGVGLHLIERGPPGAPTIVFVPGWTMPAWIFQEQLHTFGQRYRVVAVDPRGQGASDIPPGGYDYLRRGQDIRDLIVALRAPQVLLVGWSLGVLDSLSYVQQFGDSRLAGLVLIDNSVGEDPPPVISNVPPKPGPRLPREEQMRRFVAGMFRTSPGQPYLDALTAAALRTPASAAAQLGNYAVPRTYWKEAVYSVHKPVLYVVRPKFRGQAANLATKHPQAETVMFETAGHALFVDEPARFDAVLDSFIRRRVWP